MDAVNYAVDTNLFLISKLGRLKVQIKNDVNTHHILILDCSGSMWSDLPRIREQLKTKLPKLIKQQDIVSIIWFSGRDQFGTLVKAEPIATLADLASINAMIDRWLKPVALTGFLQPLQEALVLANESSKRNYVVSLFFMSDGYDNCSVVSEVLKAAEALAPRLASSTFVEYGYYCNRQLMAAMAEKAGASLIFSEDFDRYEPAFEAILQKKVSGASRIEIALDVEPVKGFAFAIKDGDLLTFGSDHGKVLVPEDLDVIWYLAEKPIGQKGMDLSACAEDAAAKKFIPPVVFAAYAAAALYGQRMQPNVVLSLLRALGDVKLIDFFSGCFGKQKYAEFCDIAKAASGGTNLFEQGRDPSRVPRDDAFTVLDLLRTLNEDDGNRILLDHPDFKYSRIGRGRVDSSDILSREEQAEIADLTAKIASTKKATEIRAYQSRINEIIVGKKEALKFIPKLAPDGYPISALKFNEERPNVSVLVRKDGTVDLSSRLPDEFRGKIPVVLDTFIWRNYTVIADGLINIEYLPCHITCATFDKLVKAGVSMTNVVGSPDGVNLTFCLRSLPVINRRMVKEVSARVLFELEYKLTEARVAQKVYNAYVKDKLQPRRVEGLASLYGEAAAVWLKEQGITDGGFSPKTVQAEAKDFYLGKELAVSLKGYSKLPSLKDLAEMIKKGKLNAPGTMMKPFVDAVEAYLNGHAYQREPDKSKALEAWLGNEARQATQLVRSMLFDKAQQVFSIIVGQTWFTDLASLDDTSMITSINGIQVEGHVEMKEIPIKL
jgi:hypothetical protein